MMDAQHLPIFRLRLSEWAVAAVLLSLGLILLQPQPTFHIYPLIYSGLERYAAEETWGLLALLLGLARLCVLFINGHWRRSPHLRSAGAFLSAFIWFQVTLGLLAVPPSLGLAVFPWLFILDVYSVYVASADARVSDERARARA